MKTTDARTFVQIVQSLDRYQRIDLTTYLMKNMCITDRSVRHYFLGTRVPDYCKQQVIVKALNKLFGIKTNVRILFNGK